MKSLIIALSVIAAFSFPTKSFTEDCNVNLPQGSGVSTLNNTLKCLSDEIKNLKRSLEESTALAKKDNPVGTVIASMLKPDLFAKIVGDPSVFDSKISRWAIADMRSVVGSTYSEKVSPQLPDLRGMFLRGMNEGRVDGRQDPNASNREGGNVAGSYQEDAFQGHYHELNDIYDASEANHGDGNTIKGGENHQNRNMKVTSPITDGINGTPRTSKETVPKNIAVYYYIKIN